MLYLDTKVLGFGAEAMVAWSPHLAAKLTYKDKYEVEVQLYRRPPDATWMMVPRGVIDPTVKWPSDVDYRTKNNMSAIDCKHGPRFDDNARCLEESLALLKSGTSHIAEAPTGWGKTYHGCAVAAALGQATLIVVTKNDLIDGWHKTLINLIGVSALDIGHCQQKVCTYKGKRFVIAMVHSLISREYDPEFYKHFGLVIFDEVHRLGADYFQEVCRLFPAYYRLGLSATPKRKDGRFRTFEAHIGPVLVRGVNIPMSPKVLVKHTGWKVPTYPKFDGDTGTYKQVMLSMSPGKLGLVVKRMAADKVRNFQIAEFVKAAYDKGYNTLILSDLIDGHLKLLFHEFALAGIPGQDMDFYIGGRTKAELEVAKNAKVLLATYAFTTEGTDIPHLDALVLATPKADVQQAIGRVMRFLPGKRTPIILDLVDNHAMFAGFHVARLKNYYAVKAEIVKML